METATVIIPIKDEERGLRFLLGDFRESQLFGNPNIRMIFVIDERTKDSSKSIAMEFSGVIIDQKGTKGKGAAIKQAVAEWKSRPSSYVVFLDADGSYSFDSVVRVMDELSNGTEVVSGSRFLGKFRRPKGMNKLHIFGNRVLSFVSSIRNRRRITDLCTGLWGFSEDALNSIEIESNGFDLEAEIAGLSRRAGLSQVEIPVEWSQRKGGVSKLRSFRDGFFILMRILRT